jgi:hypothetical protein
VDVAVFYKYDISPTAAPVSPPVFGTPPTLSDWTYAGGTTWYKNVDMTSLLGTEGTYYLHVVAYDTVGNPSDVESRFFTVDTAPPYMDNWAVTGINVVGGYTYAKADYSFTFTAEDSNALSDAAAGFPVEVFENGVRVPVAASAEADGVWVVKDTYNKSWAVTVNRTGKTDNDYSYVINIKDVASKLNTLDNNTSAVPGDDHKSFTLRVDTTRPRLGSNTDAVNASATVSLTNADTSTGTPWIGGVDAFKGIVWDNDSVTTLYYKIDTANPSYTLDTPESDFSSNSTWKSQSIQSSSAVNTAWNIPLDPSAAPINNTEGKYKLYVAAFDKAGNQINNWAPPAFPASGHAYTAFEFGYDKAAPVVSGIALNRLSDGSGVSFDSGTGLNTGFAIKGIVTDSNSLSSVTVTQVRRDEFGDIVSSGTVIKTLSLGAGYTKTSGTDKSWTLNITDLPWKDASNGTTQTELDSHTYDGEYTYTITVKDVTGITTLNMLRTSTRELTVVVDTTGPAVSITAPAIGANVNGTTLFISGTASDIFTPADLSVFYYIDTTYTATPPSGTWNPSTPTVHPDSNWNH